MEKKGARLSGETIREEEISPSILSRRREWLAWVSRIAGPVLQAGADGALPESLPVENPLRAHDAPAEALARTLAGLAPWLECSEGGNEEQEMRQRFRGLAREAILRCVDPDSGSWAIPLGAVSGPRQILVEVAFLAEAILRAPVELLEKLPECGRARLQALFRRSRAIAPAPNNWLLFSAMVEIGLHRCGGVDWDPMRIMYALNQHGDWYVGDGLYQDGHRFHQDYYNSIVIHPFILEILDALQTTKMPVSLTLHPEVVLDRAQRYAAVLERFIASDGSFPVLGRSIAYRTGCFHHLALMAQREQLPWDVSPGAVRCALREMLDRIFLASGTFDPHGWLRIGLSGSQPGLGESYISTGSLYLCCQVFLPLALPAGSRFWSAPDDFWTARRAWSGQNLPPDHALGD